MPRTTAAPDDRLLRRVFSANAAISLPWGLAVALGAPWLADPLGLPLVPTIAAGVIAVVAAVLFRRFGTRAVLRPGEGWFAAGADAAFGLGLVAVALALPEVTTLGRWLVGLSGVAVVDLAVLEAAATRRLTSGARTSPGVSLHPGR